MRHSIRLVCAAGVLALAGSGLTGSASAVEQPVFSDLVVLSGCVNVSPAVAPVFGSGSFHAPVACNPPFNALPTVCQFVSDDNIPPGVEGPADCTSGTIDGTYSNLVCGTGTAAGHASLPENDSSEEIDFLIAFVAGQGVFVGNSASDDSFDVWAGPVSIEPTAPLVPPCPVTQFRFTAAVAAVDSPVPAPIG
jgi:hypothetical protein